MLLSQSRMVGFLKLFLLLGTIGTMPIAEHMQVSKHVHETTNQHSVHKQLERRLRKGRFGLFWFTVV